MMSRWEYVRRNVKANYISQFAVIVSGFLCRTVFIRKLGAEYVGINGLYSNILGMLSLVEMGFGTALNYEMYEPVVNKNYPKMKALIKIYREAYYFVAAAIVILGLCIMPFLKKLVGEPDDVGNIYIFFLIHLAISAASYISGYFFSISNAEQKEYVSTYTNLATSLCTNILQIIILLCFNSYFLYLLISLMTIIIRQILTVVYFRKNYKPIWESEPEPIDVKTRRHIKNNIGGLITSKFSEVFIYQTDNIITAIGIDIVTVGYADNYMIIISYLRNGVLSILKSVLPSLGNMAASENIEYSRKIFRIYDLADFLIFGIIASCLINNIQMFVSLWAGADKVIDNTAVLLMCASFYLAGRSYAFNNYKTAYGIFYDVKLTCIMQALINVAVSLTGVFLLGLKGVYLGTCVSQLYYNFRTLRLAYNKLTRWRFMDYIKDRILQVGILILTIVITDFAKRLIYFSNGWLDLLFGLFIEILIFCTIIIFLYGNTYEFKYMKRKINEFLHNRRA